MGEGAGRSKGEGRGGELIVCGSGYACVDVPSYMVQALACIEDAHVRKMSCRHVPQIVLKDERTSGPAENKGTEKDGRPLDATRLSLPYWLYGNSGCPVGALLKS